MRYFFGSFELDADRYELRERSRLVPVEPRVLDLLFFLVRNHDRIVTREELLEHVWKSKFIGDSALSRCIMQARKAIASEGAKSDAIRTVHRRGYRFVEPVRVASGADAAPAEATDAASAALPVSRRPAGVDPEAAKLCARALLLSKKRSPPHMRNAIVLLEQAIEIEPDYAAAHAALGDCYLFLGFLQQSAPSIVFPKAKAAIARAIELDSTLAPAYSCRGYLEMIYEWNMTAADASLAEAVRLDDDLAIAHHRRGLFLLAGRRFAEADAALERAVVLDPLSPIFATARGLVPMAQGAPSEAVAMYRRVIESAPEFFPVHFYLGLALESCGRVDEAIEEFRTATEISSAETEAYGALGHALARAGHRDEARAIVERLRSASEHRFISPFYFAVVAAGFGDRGETLNRLEEAVAIRAVRMSDLHLDPRFAPYRSDTRFQNVLARIGTDPELSRD